MLREFNTQRLSTIESSQIKGGSIFCEWYISAAQTGGTTVDSSIMQQLNKAGKLLEEKGMKAVMRRYGSLLSSIGYSTSTATT